MARPDAPVQQLAELPSAAVEGAAGRQGLGLLAVAAALGAVLFSILLAGTGSVSRSALTPASTPVAQTLIEASGSVAVNTLAADDLAEQLPGIGPVYAARIVHTRTLFGPLQSAADLRALGIPNATVQRVLPLVSFRAQDRPGVA